jgi:hypothetical protein
MGGCLPLNDTRLLAQKNDSVYVEELRVRLRRMTDAELRRFAQATHYICSSDPHPGELPGSASVILLQECEAEWRRRHPSL